MNQQLPVQQHHYFFKSIVTFLLSTIAYGISSYISSSIYGGNVFNGLASISVIILLVAAPFYFILGIYDVNQNDIHLI